MSVETRLRAHLRDTETVIIQTVRPDGSPWRTPIWAVDADGGSYIRSSHGPASAWYSRATGPGGLAVIIDDEEVPVTLTPVTDEHLQDDVDLAYRTKYEAQPQFVGNLVSPTARPTTVRLDPVRPSSR
ncbi:DUF2255 family protein [Actinoplanes sp. TRM 88003]|uniref:DUF2255 family protein n=1 Tax=Paractinoplanes aksuensis TaxID=2939490 RepID=A0ABT1E3I1_9ACTN|nr:DUF2255 family protein [Actinoplanes aksuensis]MCO8277560.1 DUF2255 family protein [Actinoplanes aksuensis]